MEIKISASGDLLMLERFSNDYNYQPIADVINRGDIRITNLESVVSNWDCFASTFCGGQWINSEPENLDDIAKFGFNFYSCANNHSMDFSFDGVLSTRAELKRRKWNFAGIGKSLDEASAPVGVESGNVKVAIISVTSTFIDAARAGNSKEDIPARPGVNFLRVHTKYLVTKEHFEQLKCIAEKTYINGERDNARKIGSLPPEERGSINFGGHFFVVSDSEEGKFTYCNKQDMNRIRGEIQKASQDFDYVIICIHSHQIRKCEYFEADYFLEEFAHTCIDAGACAVIGGGTHQLKPVEIYNGKPIFYSIGNFVFQTDRVHKLPADFWDKYDFPENMSVQEGMNRKNQNGKIGLETDRANYLSVIPIITFDNNKKLTEIELIPIELNFNNRNKGLPRIASPEDCKDILNQLKAISSRYGTKFNQEKDNKVTILLNNGKHYGG